MRLLDLLPQYALERAISDGATYQINRTIRLFGADATVQDLDCQRVSQWLASLESCYAKRTVAGHRSNLLAVWRWAGEKHLCAPPNGIRKCPKPRPRPVAWTADEFRRLVAACERMPDPIYWRCLIRVAYDTGLRRSDLWRLQKTDVRADGTVWLSQHKTDWPHVARMSTATLADFQKLAGDAPLRPRDPRRFYDSFMWLCRLADVRPGALQMCRRTGATQIEIARPGSASRFLGHRTGTMWLHYVDRSQLPDAPIMPPEL